MKLENALISECILIWQTTFPSSLISTWKLELRIFNVTADTFGPSTITRVHFFLSAIFPSNSTVVLSYTDLVIISPYKKESSFN